ncbi:M56 family metallopeptidase [Lutibacter sp.]|uniref:M56 family metallopeptidase n=1 Tax=Lutibacter sp. TaxID=1925666 RepID=UPI0025BD4BAA|nr:M56 family metallopeptidase [Lutibacter sp.]MCF6168591.1 M56 family metallopeptidase [Lutibacter sp.]
MEYLLKASGIVVILFLFYYIFLRNETFFKSIRGYFIVGLLVILTIPLIEIPIYVKTIVSQINFTDYAEITNTEVTTYSTDWQQVIFIIYAFGVVFFSLKFLVQLISLGFLISKHPKVKHENYYFIEILKNISPFSFFNIIVYNKNQFSINELQHIINHEKAHVQQWHSVDVILSHLLVITLWFNPFVWLYKKAVQQNLEFLADSHALRLTDNHKLYQLTLLKTSGSNYCTEITNNFYNSLLKKRIIMLHKNRSTTKSQWKYALLLPILVLFIVTFNTKVIAQEKKLLDTEQLTNLKIELVIDKSSTDENLKEEAHFFKKEFDIVLTFKGIKRNSNGEITAIKIDAKGKNLRSKFENSSSNPISPIKISYNSEGAIFTIGNVTRDSKMTIHEIHKMANAHYAEKNNIKGKRYTVTATYLEDNLSEQKDSLKNRIDEDNASEFQNDFTVKTDNDKIIRYIITQKDDNVYISSENDEPLYYINGKEITIEEVKKLDPNTIEKIEVIKGKSATKKYGEKAKNGIVFITLKKE